MFALLPPRTPWWWALHNAAAMALAYPDGPVCRPPRR
jgi:hypothetical protein